MKRLSLVPTSLLYVRPAEFPLTVLLQLDTLPVLYFCFPFFFINKFLYIVLIIACIISILRTHPDFFPQRKEIFFPVVALLSIMKTSFFFFPATEICFSDHHLDTADINTISFPLKKKIGNALTNTRIYSFCLQDLEKC